MAGGAVVKKEPWPSAPSACSAGGCGFGAAPVGGRDGRRERRREAEREGLLSVP
jgi:hypothetical protein